MKKIHVKKDKGFIGSHTVVSLLKSGHQVVILDNLCNSSSRPWPSFTKAIKNQEIPFIKAISAIVRFLRRIFAENRIDSVIHLLKRKRWVKGHGRADEIL